MENRNALHLVAVTLLLPFSATAIGAVSARAPDQSISVAIPAIATGVLAIRTPQGFYTYVDASDLDTPAKVLAKSKSFGSKADEKGVPVRVYKQTTIDEPYVKPGYIPTVGSSLSRNQIHLLSRSEFAWSAGLGSRSISVAVLDDPLPEFHPALADSYDKANAYDIRHSTSYQWLTAADVDSSLGAPRIHGANVAGVLAADYSKNARAHAVHGVAPGVSIMPVMVCCYVDGSGVETRGSADDVAISNGILYAARLANNSGTLPSRKADAIVLSYDIFAGQSSFSAPVADAVQRAVGAGVLFVTGSGNGGHLSGTESTENSVSALPGVIVVSGAELTDGRISGFSTRGTAVDLAASFAALTTSVEYNSGSMSYTSSSTSGTSISAPYVAGLYALAKEAFPSLTPATFSSWINADQITFPNEYLDGYDPATNSRVNRSGVRDSDFGYGIIDAKRLINAALSAAGKPTVASLPALNPKLSIQNATNANAFQVFATIDNPYIGGSYLGNLDLSYSWDTSTAAGFPTFVGHTSTDQITSAELCSDSVGAREVTAQTSSTLKLIGFSILPTPAACGYGVIFLNNGYNGSFSVTVTANSFFAPSGTDTKAFTVGAPPPPAVVIGSFSASPSSITSGQSSNLSWAVSNATACTLDGHSVPATATQTVQPTATTSYALSCTGAGSPASRSITLTVTPPSSSGGASGGSSGAGSSGGGSASLSLLAALGLIAATRRRRRNSPSRKNESGPLDALDFE